MCLITPLLKFAHNNRHLFPTIKGCKAFIIQLFLQKEKKRKQIRFLFFDYIFFSVKFKFKSNAWSFYQRFNFLDIKLLTNTSINFLKLYAWYWQEWLFHTILRFHTRINSPLRNSFCVKLRFHQKSHSHFFSNIKDLLCIFFLRLHRPICFCSSLVLHLV